MSARVFTFDQFTDLHDQAKASPRLRQHLNIHASHEAPFQRLFIAFGLDSYVRPHRHHLAPKDETLVAVQGLLGVLVFDDAGQVVQQFKLGTQSHSGPDVGPVVDMPAGTWHTVLALTPDAVLLEGKAGPFDPQGPREFADWAPEEGTDEALALLRQWRELFAGSHGAAKFSASSSGMANVVTGKFRGSKIAAPTSFTPQALKRWESIPGEIRQRLLRNVWCGGCGISVTITHFTGRIERGDLILTGQCNQCHGEVARVIEGA